MISFLKWFTLLGMIVIALLTVMMAGGPPTLRLGSGQESRTIESWIKLEPARPVLDEREESPRSEQLTRLRQTVATLIRSPNVLSAAAQAPQIRNLPLIARNPDLLAWLEARIRVDERSAEILCISMLDAPREEQAMIVNAVAGASIDAARDWESSARAKRMEVATHAYASSRTELADLRKLLREPKGMDPEQLAAIRDQISVQEEMVHRLGLAVEHRKLETVQPDAVRLIAEARP